MEKMSFKKAMRYTALNEGMGIGVMHIIGFLGTYGVFIGLALTTELAALQYPGVWALPLLYIVGGALMIFMYILGYEGSWVCECENVIKGYSADKYCSKCGKAVPQDLKEKAALEDLI